MSKTYRFAVIGTGDIAKFYVGHFLKRKDQENIEYIGAWNRTQAKAEAFTKEFGGRVFDQLDDLLQDPNIDIIINLTSAQAHAPITLQALKAGKHVFSEKPLAMSLNEANELIQCSEVQQKLLCCAPFILLGDRQQEIKKQLLNKKIGKPLMITSALYHGRVEVWHPNPSQFYQAGAGPVLDVGPYPLSVMVHLLGEIESVQAMMEIGLPKRKDLKGNSFEVEVPDFGYAMLRFKSGALGRLDFSQFNSKSDLGALEIQGDHGSCSLEPLMDFHGVIKWSKRDSNEWNETIASPDETGIDWSEGLIEMVRSLRENRKTPIHAKLARHVLAVALAIQESAQSGQRIEIP